MQYVDDASGYLRDWDHLSRIPRQQAHEAAAALWARGKAADATIPESVLRPEVIADLRRYLKDQEAKAKAVAAKSAIKRPVRGGRGRK